MSKFLSKSGYPFILKLVLASLLFIVPASAQALKAGNSNKENDVRANAANSLPSQDNDAKDDEKADVSGKQKYRLLQSNDFLVDTAYLQDDDELQHTFNFSRSNRRNWAMTFSEEIPLGSDKQQLSFSMPAQLAKNEEDSGRGFGDVEIQYNYGLIGSSSSRVTVSPGFGINLPTGNWKRELGRGGVGLSLKLPIGVMLTDRIASNTSFETTFTKSARNSGGDRANTVDFEFGQSFVWFAKPKLNFLIETVWERSQEVLGNKFKENERELLISPGVRWAHSFKNGLIISPGFALPVGVGPSRGEKGVFFYLTFEHAFKKSGK